MTEEQKNEEKKNIQKKKPQNGIIYVGNKPFKLNSPQ